MNKLDRTFMLVGLVVAILLSMYQLPELYIGGARLRPVNILSSVLPDSDTYVDAVIPQPVAPKPLVARNEKGDTAAFHEKWSKGVQPILDYSSGKSGGMDHFYDMLLHRDSIGRPVRIAYYGDSYIEGDILTSDLRRLFQQRYGGYGVGWVDCGTEIVRSRRSIQQKYSGVTEYMVMKKPFNVKVQGISERYYEPAEGAVVTTSSPPRGADSTRWQTSTLFFRTSSPVLISVTTPSAGTTTTSAGGGAMVQSLVTEAPASTVTYKFNGVTPGTYLYGMALESHKGVILDNFSMRASSGVSLKDIPLDMMKRMNNMRPYDLIVLHFGLNMAVKGNNADILHGYMNKMKLVVNHFREAFPDASILVMSMPDRAQRSADGIKTLNEVKNLVAFQQQLAVDCGVSFLNFFQAMGGEGSVVRLVDRHMANTDYTHLSFAGGRYVASQVFPSFVEGLENFRRRMQYQHEHDEN